MSSSINEVKDVWEAHAQHDPLWAVMSWAGKEGRKWKIEEFLDTGRHDIDSIIDDISGLNIAVNHGTALDFGCGIGRLTQPLASHFDSVVGVDISKTMIDVFN